jgi:hypothetical protein
MLCTFTLLVLMGFGGSVSVRERGEERSVAARAKRPGSQ